ncbi:MAG: hypothetical protein CL450_08865 [Acidimicrobiaceae bacterium]|nr:hypothetical protein [Acidimicrobiaceae bacterium]
MQRKILSFCAAICLALHVCFLRSARLEAYSIFGVVAFFHRSAVGGIAGVVLVARLNCGTATIGNVPAAVSAVFFDVTTFVCARHCVFRYVLFLLVFFNIVQEKKMR